MLTDDPKSSTKEAKARFLQETARISLNAYLTFITMNLFKKNTDKSARAALLIQGINVIVSEVIGRKLIGKPVLRISKDQIDAYNRNTPGSIPLKSSEQANRLKFKGDNHEISFKGKSPKLFNTLTKKEFMERMEFLEKLDKSLHEKFKELIDKKVGLDKLSENEKINFGEKET